MLRVFFPRKIIKVGNHTNDMNGLTLITVRKRISFEQEIRARSYQAASNSHFCTENKINDP